MSNNLVLPYENELQSLCAEISNQQLSKYNLGQHLKQFLERNDIPYNHEEDSPVRSTLFGTIHVLADWLQGVSHSVMTLQYLSHRSGIDRVKDIITSNNLSPNNIYNDFLDYMSQYNYDENI